jgi:hypothetical protein
MSATTVVNVKVKHLRAKGFDTLEEWMNADPRHVYVGRKGVLVLNGRRFPPQSSLWANPFKVGRDGTAEEVSVKFYEHLGKLLENPDMQRELRALQGCHLGCWCVPADWVWDETVDPRAYVCHGQVLCHFINRLSV